MKISDWGLEIIRVGNGYKIKVANQSGDPAELGYTEEVIEDREEDELRSGEELLWFIMDFFAFGGSKHDKERLRIVREPGEKYPVETPDAN